MSGEIHTTIVGNLGDDPELRFTTSGVAVAKLSVANTPRKRAADGTWTDDEPTWIKITAWRTLAENVAVTLQRGSRAVVYGTLKNRKYTDKEGVTRYSLEMEAIAIGPDLTWVTAKIGAGAGAKPRDNTPQSDDPWDGAVPAQQATPKVADTPASQRPQSDAPPW